jgi:LmbE family N-acetylglucosaminyl deacetylase
MKKLLVVTAHPDDEAFGPGGTIAYYAKKGVEIHLLSATKGESGLLHEKVKFQKGEKVKIQHIREKELINSAKILGVRSVEFLGFTDGYLSNANYHLLAGKIRDKINTFQPQVVLTLDQKGVSGHIDHIVVSLTTTYAFINTNIGHKLYYYCIPKENREKRLDKYFIYFPQGYDQKEISTRIDYSSVWNIKKDAMQEHKSQWQDVENLIKWNSVNPKIDHYILHMSRGIGKTENNETDLFAGIKSA